MSETLGRHLARLQRGDGLDHTPNDRFGQNTLGGNTPEQRANASRLGYGVGSVSAAFARRGSSLSGDASEIAEVVGYVVPNFAEDMIELGLNAVAGPSNGRLERMREILEDGSIPMDASVKPYENEVRRVYVDERDRVVSLPINN